MNARTDLALEAVEALEQVPKGIEKHEENLGKTIITRIIIKDKQGEEAVGKPIGTYITIKVPPFGENGGFDEDSHTAIKKEIEKLIPETGSVLIVGIGNTAITPDAFGPKTAEGILATRHISGELARSVGLDGLRSVAVINPGVLGQTGIESAEIIKSIALNIEPTCVICIDALAAQSLSRLGNTVQIADSGICPGSGVGNKRNEISERTIGIKVVSIGVPTVVDAEAIVSEFSEENKLQKNENLNMIVTPREIDLVIDRSAEMISFAINCALQKNIDPKILQSLV